MTVVEHKYCTVYYLQYKYNMYGKLCTDQREYNISTALLNTRRLQKVQKKLHNLQFMCILFQIISC